MSSMPRTPMPKRKPAGKTGEVTNLTDGPRPRKPKTATKTKPAYKSRNDVPLGSTEKMLHLLLSVKEHRHVEMLRLLVAV